jgi:hypothetical protein
MRATLFLCYLCKPDTVPSLPGYVGRVYCSQCGSLATHLVSMRAFNDDRIKKEKKRLGL